jgi:hypothetical protein
MSEENMSKKWVGGICVNDGKVLLIHRINKKSGFNKEYFVFPGKTVEDDQALEQAFLESFKNISITVKLGELLYSKDDELEYYYLSEYITGEPSFIATSVEAKEMEEGGHVYIPMWVELSELDDLIVYPESVKALILDSIQEN